MKLQASSYRNKGNQLHFRVMMDEAQAKELVKVKGDGIVKELTSALEVALKNPAPEKT